MANGVDHTFTVATFNLIGTGPAYSPSTPIRVGAPVAPAFLRVGGGNTAATLTWWPPSANGSPLTGYVVTPTSGRWPRYRRRSPASPTTRTSSR